MTQAQTAAIPGVTVVRSVRAQRIGVLVVTLVPFAGVIAAVISLWGWAFTWIDAAIFALMYAITCLGVTVGFHRGFTHGSFKAGKAVRGVLAATGSMAIQGAVIDWVANHRRHHAFSDQEGDPHSPHLDEGEGIKGIARGLWHAHMGWLFGSEHTEADRWAPDMVKDPLMRKMNRLFPLWIVVSFAAPAVLGFLLTWSWQGAVTAFLWGSFVRVFLLHHITWSINSICHFFGRRPFETTDHSTNNWPLALVSMGESWHNNHHAFPTAAHHGLRWYQVDVSGTLISIMARFGWVWDVKMPTLKQMSAKSVT